MRDGWSNRKKRRQTKRIEGIHLREQKMNTKSRRKRKGERRVRDGNGGKEKGRERGETHERENRASS